MDKLFLHTADYTAASYSSREDCRSVKKSENQGGQSVKKKNLFIPAFVYMLIKFGNRKREKYYTTINFLCKKTIFKVKANKLKGLLKD